MHVHAASEAVAAPSKAKRATKKAVNLDRNSPDQPSRKKATAHANTNGEYVDKAPAKPKTRKKQPVSNDDQDAPRPPKRGRPKKAATTDPAATPSTTDATAPVKSAAKRGRKRAVESEDAPGATAAKEPKPKPLPRPRKTKATDKTKPPVDEPAIPSETSPHQEPVTLSEAAPVQVAQTSDLVSQPHVQPHVPVQALDLDPAPKRRRNWTPPPEPDFPPSFQRSGDASPEPRIDALIDGESIKDASVSVDFTNLMGNFGYQNDSFDPPRLLSRTSSDAPTTKRKRPDPVDITAVEEPQKRKKLSEPKPKPPKKPKALKKKPVTITALATAAYRAQPTDADADADTEQPKLISDFFQQPELDPATVPTDQPVPAKRSKPIKSSIADDKPAPKRKRTKKVQITVSEAVIELDAPEAALENMERQQWLFGSSSQLAAAESPTELRDLQQALKESEDMISSQHIDDSYATSYAHVPSAPHGTSLSIGQANRVLWMSAARDFEDSTFASDESPDDVPQDFTGKNLQLRESAADQSNVVPKSQTMQEAAHCMEILTISSPASDKIDSPDLGYVDIDNFGDSPPQTTLPVERLTTRSPVKSTSKTAPMITPGSHEVIELDVAPETENSSRRALSTRDPNVKVSKQVIDVDSKIFIASPREANVHPSMVLLDSPGKRPRGRPRKVVDNSAAPLSPGLVEKGTSQKSDLPASSFTGSKRVAATTVPGSPSRPRERARKAFANPLSISPSKPRGRPPKLGAIRALSPARSRGRSRKPASPSALPSPFRAPVVQGALPRVTDRLPAIQGALLHGGSRTTTVQGALPHPGDVMATVQGALPYHEIIEVSSDYLDIDAISDVEVASHALSPPRRLPNSPPRATLDFDRPPPPSPIATVPAAKCTAKQLQAEFPIIATTLFPRITQTVKSTPPSRDHKKPTWHEKMLLYDPIVLEDLTAWLNVQGLRIEVARPRLKGKKKVGEAVEEVLEMVQEELQPWMVQKWCEEHSICCLWKEGLRGGVRQKY